jgi:hypothetical protein
MFRKLLKSISIYGIENHIHIHKLTKLLNSCGILLTELEKSALIQAYGAKSQDSSSERELSEKYINVGVLFQQHKSTIKQQNRDDDYCPIPIQKETKYSNFKLLTFILDLRLYH